MPYVLLYEFDICGTAIIGLSNFNPKDEYEPVSIPLLSKQILWADYIVFPFTKTNISSLYENIRFINPEVKIIFNVDFNYYKLSKNHSLYDSFFSPEIFGNIEDNIFYSDLCMTTNTNLCEFLKEKFTKELNDSKYSGIESNVEILSIPLLIDENTVCENISIEEKPQVIAQDSLRIGIIASHYTWEDLNAYKAQFSEVKKKLGDKVTSVMIGFDGVDIKSKKKCFDSDFTFEYVKPCTIVHYYKQLQSLNLDLVFIPLRKNEFNETSENYNKYLECSIFKIPVMVGDNFPYNKIIKTGENGIIVSDKKDFLSKIEHFIAHKSELKRIGMAAYEFVQENFTYTEQTIDFLDKEVYS